MSFGRLIASDNLLFIHLRFPSDTYSHPNKHIGTQIPIQTQAHRNKHTHIRTHTHTHTHTYTHSHKLTGMRIHTHNHTHSPIHTHIKPYKHTHTHTHTYRHVHTHTSIHHTQCFSCLSSYPLSFLSLPFTLPTPATPIPLNQQRFRQFETLCRLPRPRLSVFSPGDHGEASVISIKAWLSGNSC